MNIKTLRDMKSAGKRIVTLTAYDVFTGRLLEGAGVDIVLVGDSLGNNVLGYDDTIPVTMDDMVHHTKAVRRGAANSFVVADMPFMSYQVNAEEALRNASRLVKEAGANAVKLEGVRHLDAVRKIIEAGIPVMGHIGFTPQSVNQLGGYRVQGRALQEVKELIESAKLLEKSGVFAFVLEMVPAAVAEKVSRAVSIPVIGCGSGPYCDGQVLVLSDILGMSAGNGPSFAKKYVDLQAVASNSVAAFVSEVRAGSFPDKDHSF